MGGSDAQRSVFEAPAHVSEVTRRLLPMIEVVRHLTNRRLASLVLLWTWALPASVLWNLAASRNLALPQVPRIIWGLPGWLWGSSPALWCACLAGASIAAYRLSDRFLAGWLGRVIIIWVLAAVVSAVHLLWGSAVMCAT